MFCLYSSPFILVSLVVVPIKQKRLGTLETFSFYGLDLTVIYVSWFQIFFQYPEGHVSKSMYAVFKLVSGTTSCKLLEDFIPNLGLAVWTTTPWTIPANAGKLFILSSNFFI